MSLTQPSLDRPPVPQVCQRCRQEFPGDSTLMPSALIEWWACGPCRVELGLDLPAAVAPVAQAEPADDDLPSTTDCWYAIPANRPTTGRCPRRCNGAPVASELVTGGTRRLYCESHWYWRRSDAPTAVLRHL